MSKNADSAELIEKVVSEVSALVSQMAGIQLGPRQSSMVVSRLKSRMLKLGIDQFSGYLKHLKLNVESESQALLSLMTTHHTFFFREFSHFEFLLNKGLGRVIEAVRKRDDKKIRIWSAASSKGQEAYSLAMFLQFHLKQMAPELDFEVIGTDVDPSSVSHAKNGVYKAEELKQSPAMYIENNWIRGKGKVRDFSKVKDPLKAKCHFEVANLLRADAFLKNKTFDIIFCRNVFIYFNQEQIKDCTKNILNHLHQDGFLFLGVSESLNGLGLKIQNCGPSVYEHIPDAKSLSPKKSFESSYSARPQKMIEVLCVDDSKSIHALLAKILTKENGFTIKAVANNGLEALDRLKQDKFDVITLDLHMPELDGIGFLKASKGMNRPPVIILSAINRDDPTIAMKAIENGAVDYVEKPSLENLAQAGNEIRSKLKTVLAVSSASRSNSQIALPQSEGLQIESSTLKLNSKKKVLIVDDSQTVRTLLTKILSSDPELEVVATAESPLEVEALIIKHRPDVITLDIHMPEMDGVSLLKKIQPKFQIPTVMISSISKEEGQYVLNALECGAVDYIQKPQMTNLSESSQLIKERIKIAAHAKVRRKSLSKRVVGANVHDKSQLILIGASTGGTEALREVLQSLPEKIPPILIVQHIPPVFSAAFASRLNDLCPFPVREAKHGEEVKPNQVLIAPGGTQMGIRTVKDKVYVTVNDDAPMNRHKPSVDYLFQSAADNQITQAVAVILTGMGSDGAKMMKRLRAMGVRTIAQSKETCVVYGMPREAVESGAVEFIEPLESIGQKMMDLSTSVKLKKTG